MDTQDSFVERYIVTGLIVSTEYIEQIYPHWKDDVLSAPAARTIARWCLRYFEKYKKAPEREIEKIFTFELKKGTLHKDRAEQIEEVLDSLSSEYSHSSNFNVSYLLDQTRLYMKSRALENHVQAIQNLIEEGNVLEAEAEATNFTPGVGEGQIDIEPFSRKAKERIRQAFKEQAKPLIRFGRDIGFFWNRQLVRDSFVAFMGPEKCGKTFMLIELAMRAWRSGCNVAFFQAGDMSEAQQIRRLAIYLARRSDRARYCNDLYIPVMDCIYNQLDTCQEENRESDYGPFVGKKIQDLYNITYDELVEGYHEYGTDYKPCHNCRKYRGAIWFTMRPATKPLTWLEAIEVFRKYRKRYRSKFKLSTYSNESLTVSEIKAQLSIWEKQRFHADVIIVDYADLLAPDPDIRHIDFRNQNNKIWQRLRSLSQEKHCIVISATQAAASSYEHDLLQLSDFSEDKRKYAHVTAMYGLNQKEEEKRIGLMRINEIVVREDEFDRRRPIKVLQRLQIGRPYLGGFR